MFHDKARSQMAKAVPSLSASAADVGEGVGVPLLFAEPRHPHDCHILAALLASVCVCVMFFFCFFLVDGARDWDVVLRLVLLALTHLPRLAAAGARS